jgi:hypothetical protein
MLWLLLLLTRLMYVFLPCEADYKSYFFPLWLYSPTLGLGRLHETFRFISVTKSRTVDRTPWMGDQLVTRPLLTAPGDCDDEVGRMNDFWQGKPKYSEKTCPDATLSTTNPTCQTWSQTRAAAVGSQRLTKWAMVRPRNMQRYINNVKKRRAFKVCPHQHASWCFEW